MGYLLDSNVLIDYTSNRFSSAQLKVLDNILDTDFNISVITKIEILGFKVKAEEERQMEIFLSSANIISLTDVIVEKTIALKKIIKIKTPDAIISATAIVNDLTLITNNTADFKRIKELKIYNPYSEQ